MKEHEIEKLAEEVLQAYGQKAVPVDLAGIAAAERIELCPGDYGDDFHGRIEYLPRHGTFALFHQRLPDRFPGRVRFTIGHELGHYFIEEHREILMRGIAHYSEESFTAKNPIEKEADQFASALLIPRKAVEAAMKAHGFLTLDGIFNLAIRCQSSARAAALRYIALASEPCVVIVSKDGKVLYSRSSEDAEVRGFGGLGQKTVPAGSPTSMAAVTVGKTIGAETSTTAWFSPRYRSSDLWEDAQQLGQSSTVLTLLSWKND